MRQHPLIVKRIGAVINDVAGQQNDVHLFGGENRGEAVKLARAKEKAAVEMDVGGDAQTQRLRHWLVERDGVVAHHRAVGVEKAPGKERGKSGWQKEAQRRRRFLARKRFTEAVQDKPRRCRQKPQPQKRQ